MLLPNALLTVPPPACLRCSPAGQYAKLVSGTYVCTACKANYYRSGDASPRNNVCRPIPAGYMELSGAGVDAQSQVVPCPVGTASSWSGDATNPATSTATRTPATATQCAPCTNNLYAPRTGMTQCVACKGGTRPTKSSSGLLGPNQCTSCATADGVNTFRSAFTLRCAAHCTALHCIASHRIASHLLQAVLLPAPPPLLTTSLAHGPPASPLPLLSCAAPLALTAWPALRPPPPTTRPAPSASPAL